MRIILILSILLGSLNLYSQDYYSDRLFVKVKEEFKNSYKLDKELNLVKSLSAAKIMSVLPVSKHPLLNSTYEVIFEKELVLDSIVSQLSQLEQIEYAEKVPIYKLFFTPNDPLYSSQWNLAKIQADLAWNLGQGCTQVKIAVTDDGFLMNHEDLVNQWHINTVEINGNGIDDDGNGYIDDWRGWDAANNDNDPSATAPTNSFFTHGTHVAGIVAAQTNNSTGIASIGYNCKMIPVKIGSSPSSALTGAFQGLDYAINSSGCDVINMSWGGGGWSATYQALFNIAKTKGILCVAAAGNSNTSTPMYPASYNHVISVAASSSTDARASFSNFGSTIDVTAPGVGIPSCLAGATNAYGNMSGTSMASPLVAGLCGLMKCYNPMPADSIEACLKRTCDNINTQNPSFIGQLGAGRINAFQALQCLTKKPKSDFIALDTFQCIGKSVRYAAKSFGIPSLTYSWSFPGGTPSTSTSANPVVTYASNGLKSATLITCNSLGCDTITKINYVTIDTPKAWLTNRNYTSNNSNPVIITVHFKGNPPFNVTLTDGTNNFTQTNIRSNPYFFSIVPKKDTSLISISSFSDSLCVGNRYGLDTIIRIQLSNSSFCRDSAEVTSAQTGWQALQTNGSWGSLTASNYCAGTFAANTSLFPGVSASNCLWGPTVNTGTRTAYNSSSHTSTSTFTGNFPYLKKQFTLPAGSVIDSVRLWMISDDYIDSVWVNNKVVYKATNPVHYGQIVMTGSELNLGNSNSPFNEVIVKPGDFGGCYGTYFRMKVYYRKVCGSISDCDTTGLILCMSMDGNANDSTKFSHNGLVRGASLTTGRNGTSNSAYYFDGTTSHISLGVKSMLKPNAASISVWVKPHAFNSYTGGNANCIFLTKNPNNPGSYMEAYSLYLTNRSGPTKFMTISTHQPSTNEKWFQSIQNTNLNQWTHLVLTFDYDSLKLYVNGQLDNKTYKGFYNVYDALDSIMIGYSANTMNKNYFKGDMDELKMYNRVLSAIEVQNLYAKPFTCTCSSTPPPSDCDTTNLNTGKVLHLDFNGNTQDKSGNGNHATNFGAIAVAGKDGVANTAYKFDGVNDYMKVLHSTSLGMNSAYTITCKMKIDGWNTATCHGNMIFFKGNTTPSAGNQHIDWVYAPNAYNGGCIATLDTLHQNLLPGSVTVSSPTAYTPYLNSGKWYCFAVVQKNDTLYNYIDGVMVYRTPNTGTGSNTYDIFIGKSNYASYPYWLNATIDDIRVYNRSLAPSEVKGYCGTCNVTPPPPCDTAQKYTFTQCLNDSIQVIAGAGSKYQWSPSTGLSNDTIRNPKVFVSNNQRYLVSYTSSKNCQLIDTIDVEVKAAAIYPKMDDQLICIGDSVQMTIPIYATNIVWSPNTAISSISSKNPFFFPTTNRTYYLEFRDTFGCLHRDTFEVNTKVCCPARARFTIPKDLLCFGETLAVTNTSKGPITSYNWNFSTAIPNTFIGVNPPLLTFPSGVSYTLRLIVTNGSCFDTMTKTVNVVHIIPNAGRDTTNCLGAFTAKLGESAISDWTYNWTPTKYLSDPKISNPICSIVNDSVNYVLEVVDRNSGCKAYDTVVVYTNRKIDSTVQNIRICGGDSVLFNGVQQKTTGNYYYTIKKADGICDSFINVLRLNVLQKQIFQNIPKVRCEFYIDAKGKKHTVSFIERDTIKSWSLINCDSIITITSIEIFQKVIKEKTVSGCAPFRYNGKTYSISKSKADSIRTRGAYSGCDSIIEYINVIVYPKPIATITPSIPNPVMYKQTVTLTASGGQTYLWIQTGSTNQEIDYKINNTQPKLYTVRVTDENDCWDTVSYIIRGKLPDTCFYGFPNVFSPNQDNLNDEYIPNMDECTEIKVFAIYDRWGEKVFETNEQKGWKGFFKGKPAPMAVYLYYAELITPWGIKVHKGTFTLVR